MNHCTFSKIWIIVVLVALFAGGVLVWQYSKAPEEEVKVPEIKISEEEAINLVKNLPEVKEWLSLFGEPDRDKAIIEFSHVEEGKYVIHVYELVPTDGHTATFDWYYVNPYTSEIRNIREEVVSPGITNWKTYRNTLWGYEISYPEEFYLLTNLRVDAVTISNVPDPWPHDIGPHEKITLDIYRSLNYKMRPLEYFMDEKDEKILIGDQEALRGINEKFPAIITFFIRDDNYNYTIRGVSGTYAYFDQYRDLIEKIQNTFRFIEKEEVLEPTGVELSQKSSWWAYRNTKYKYIIEFPDEVGIENYDFELELSRTSKKVNFYLEEHPAIPNLLIDIPLLNFQEAKLSLNEFINQFVKDFEKKETITIGGEKAIKLSFKDRWEIKTNSESWSGYPDKKIIFMKHNNTMFVISVIPIYEFDYKDPKYEDIYINAEDTFNQMLSTFRFLE